MDCTVTGGGGEVVLLPPQAGMKKRRDKKILIENVFFISTLLRSLLTGSVIGPIVAGHIGRPTSSNNSAKRRTGLPQMLFDPAASFLRDAGCVSCRKADCALTLLSPTILPFVVGQSRSNVFRFSNVQDLPHIAGFTPNDIDAGLSL